MDETSEVQRNDGKVRKLFVLIHGTWAPNSSWTQKGESLLRQRLENSFHDNQKQRIAIIAPTWSGSNRESKRISGGKKVAEEIVNKLDGPDCDEFTDVFLLTHSHGTDVALKALEEIGKNSPDPQHNKNRLSQIRGIASFNSPNILTLRRDIANAMSQFVVFLRFAAFFVFLTTVSLIILSFYPAVGLGPGTGSANVIFFVLLIAFYLLANKFAKVIVEKLDRHATKSQLDDFRVSVLDKNKTTIIAINSSSDEAWNVLNLLTLVCQIPFYVTHRFFILLFTVFLAFVIARDPDFFEEKHTVFLSSILNDVTSYRTFPAIQGHVDSALEKNEQMLSTSKDIEPLTYLEIWTTPVILELFWWIGSFSSVFAFSLLCMALLALVAIAIGYLLSFFVEALALGTPRWPSLEFLTTRKCIGLVPLNASNLTFFDAGVGGSFLDHSLPYNSARVLDRVMLWIEEHSRDSPPSTQTGVEL